MASSTYHAFPYCVRGYRFTLPVVLLDADGDPTAPTGWDSERSVSGGAFADCTEEVTAPTGAAGEGYLTLDGDETNASLLLVRVKDTGAAVKTSEYAFVPAQLPTVETGTATAGASNTITLAAGASGVTQFYRGMLVGTTGGTGGGGGSGKLNNQLRVITSYNYLTKVATVFPQWETTPDNTTTYEILLPSGMQYVNVGRWNGTDLATPDTAGYPVATIKDGTSQGELNLASGVVDANLVQIIAAAITQAAGAGKVAAAFSKLHDVTTPLLDCSAAMRGTDSAALASAWTATRAGYVDELAAENLPTDVDGINAKTVNLPSDPADQSAVEAVITAATSPLATSVEVAALPTDDDVQTAAAAALSSMGLQHVVGKTGLINDAAATTTSFITDLTGVDNQYRHRVFFITQGGATLYDCPAVVTAYDSVTKRLTVAPALPTAPVNGHPFALITVPVILFDAAGKVTASTVDALGTQAKTDVNAEANAVIEAMMIRFPHEFEELGVAGCFAWIAALMGQKQKQTVADQGDGTAERTVFDHVSGDPWGTPAVVTVADSAKAVTGVNDTL